MAHRAVKKRRQQNHHEQQPRSREVTIPDDIIFAHILPLLPLLSVVRFQCVSKSWYTCLRHPQFLKDHCRRHSQLLTVITSSTPSPTTQYPHRVVHARQFQSLTLFDDDNLSTASMQIHEPPKNELNIVASCNGYILLEQCFFMVRQYLSYVMWNPTTSTSIVIPDSRTTQRKYFDWNHMVYGFGYDPINHDYKIILIKTYGVDYMQINSQKTSSWRSTIVEDGVKYTQIYSQKTSSWRSILGEFPGYMLAVRSRSTGVYVSGFLHWPINYDARDGHGERVYDEADSVIACFDVAKEVFMLVPLPAAEDKYNIEISCLDGMLCMLGMVEGGCDLWVMKEYGIKESWTKLMSLPYLGSAMKPLYLTYTGKLILQLDHWGTIVRYDPKEKLLYPKTLVDSNGFDHVDGWTVFGEKT